MHFCRGEVQSVKIHMILDGKIPTVQAAEHLRRHPSCSSLNVLSSMPEDESIAGLHKSFKLSDGLGIGIFHRRCFRWLDRPNRWDDASADQRNHIGHGLSKQISLFARRHPVNRRFWQADLGQVYTFLGKNFSQGFKGSVSCGRSTVSHCPTRGSNDSVVQARPDFLLQPPPFKIVVKNGPPVYTIPTLKVIRQDICVIKGQGCGQRLG